MFIVLISLLVLLVYNEWVSSLSSRLFLQPGNMVLFSNNSPIECKTIDWIGKSNSLVSYSKGSWINERRVDVTLMLNKIQDNIVLMNLIDVFAQSKIHYNIKFNLIGSFSSYSLHFFKSSMQFSS